MTLFGTAGIRGPVADTVTPSLALAVGRGVGVEADSVVVGRDGRVTGSALAAAVQAGAQSTGASVARVGQVPTPALAFASRDRYGVMLTASHNPPADNGIKLFDDGVEFDAAAERRIDERVETDPDSADWTDWGDHSTESVLDEYRSAVAAFAADHGSPLENLGVVVDCGNGMGARATPHVLRRLGASVTTLNANVDGHFSARESKPTPETLAGLMAYVAADPEADIGIGHDGDADRIVVVDGDGDIVHEDTVVALLAEHYVARSGTSDPVVVTTPNASGRIDERVEVQGGRVERVALGSLHEGIADARDAGGDVVFAAEPWKHVHPAFGGWIDGVISAAVVSCLVAESGLDALREPITERPYRKQSVDCPDDRKEAVMDRLKTTLPERFPDAAVSLDHGVRLSFEDNAWTLVRPSGTEPYVRVYAESEAVETLIGDVSGVVRDAVETFE